MYTYIYKLKCTVNVYMCVYFTYICFFFSDIHTTMNGKNSVLAKQT